jgi:hypothetical protein
MREGADFIAPIIVYLATDDARNITGQTFYACGGDVCIFDRPLQMTGPIKFIRTQGKWNIEDLSTVIPGLISV